VEVLGDRNETHADHCCRCHRAADRATRAAEGPNKDTGTLEAQYKACLAHARDLQKRYSDCKSKECTDTVTADFEAWSAKCFKD
jgi:hypothetical protein